MNLEYYRKGIKMSKPTEKFRDLLLSDNIDNTSVKDIIKEIMEINFDDNEKENEYKDWERKPIRLFINSFGGSVYDGLALVDVIKRSKTPVYTICIGSCMSMGFWIWLAGQKRIIGETATLMFHDMTTWVWDKSETLKQELQEVLRLQKIIITEITNKSLIEESTLQDYIIRKAEWYISPSEAIELKLADEYYK